jgi:hypothetical protein
VCVCVFVCVWIVLQVAIIRRKEDIEMGSDPGIT